MTEREKERKERSKAENPPSGQPDGPAPGVRTPWILTVGEGDKTVKTWNHAGAPLGKLSKVKKKEKEEEENAIAVSKGSG